jgi:pSer/pThr/pTyr-binding forkhead associated (FHA) protein
MQFFLASLVEFDAAPCGIAAERVLIGRGDDCDVRLASHFVSRHHAEAWVEQDTLYLRDLGSRNGTVVNGAPIRRATGLEYGDIVSFGTESFVVRAAPAAAGSEISLAAVEQWRG